jgi:MSHA biogenesis protein MshP
MMQLTNRQRGVGLVTAIFLLVVIAGLAAAMVTVFTAQQTGSQLDQQGTRAYQAARAGIEWGLFRARQAGSCEDPSTSTSTFALPAASNLAGFTVTVRCRQTGTAGEAATPIRVITATACNQPTGGVCGSPVNNLDFVQRVIEVQL